MIAGQKSELSVAEQLEQARWIEQVCLQFERDWRAGRTPRIEDVLATADEPGRRPLMEALLAVEFELRFEKIPPPQLAAYLQRFPQAVELVERTFGAVWADCQAAELDAAAVAEPTVSPRDGQPRHELGDEIARGGMGIVYRCRDTTLGRELALKTLLPEHRNKPEAVWRFENEARISARLQHPGVPPVHELGRLDDGRPFLTMRLVQGQTLAEILQAAGEDGIESRRRKLLEILHDVCQTVAYAHDHNTIHRDLKPANVMVGAFGEVQVMDWGLAKELSIETRSVSEEGSGNSSEMKDSSLTLRVGIDDPDADSSLTLRVGIDGTDADVLLTSAGLILGTLSYMPPEQARGAAHDLDKRADVFSLGAMLCEILSGHSPYWRETEPMAAESRWRESVAKRLQDCSADAELVRLTLDCLHVDRELRPADAGQVTRRLGEYLFSVDERLRRAELDRTKAETKAIEARKRTRVLRLLAVLLFAVATGSIVAAAAYQRLADQKEQARTGESLHRKVAERAEATAAVQRDLALAAEATAQAARHDAELAVADLYAQAGVMEAKLGKPQLALLKFAAAARQAGQDEDRRWANLVRFRAGSRGLPTPAAFLPTERIDRLTFHPSAPLLIARTFTKQCDTIWNLHTEQPLALPEEFGQVRAATWNADGTLLAVGNDRGQWHLCKFQWNTPPDSGSPAPTVQSFQTGSLMRGISVLAFDAAGRYLAAAANNRVQVWDIEKQEWLNTGWEHPAQILDLQFNPVRHELLTCADDDQFRVYELKNQADEPVLQGKHVSERRGKTRLRPVLSQDGDVLLAAEKGGKVVFWDLASRTERRQIDSPSRDPFWFRTSPDGNTIAIAGRIGVAAINFAGEVVMPVRTSRNMFSCDFTRDGRLISAGEDPLAEIWSPDAKGTRLGVAAVTASAFMAVECSTDGQWLAAADMEGPIRVWRMSGERPREFQIPTDTQYGIARFTSDGRYMLTMGRTASIRTPRIGLRVWATDSMQPAGPVLKCSNLPHCAFSPDDRFVATVASSGMEDAPGEVALWDWRSGETFWPPVAIAPQPVVCAFHPDGTELAVLSKNGTVTLVDASNGRVTAEWETGYQHLEAGLRTPLLAYADGGRLLVYFDGIDAVAAWNVAASAPHLGPFRNGTYCTHACLSPDGQTLATGGSDGLVQRWNLITGESAGAALKHPAAIYSLAFSDDGRWIATGCRDFQVRVWDTETGLVAGPSIPARHSPHVGWIAGGRAVLIGTHYYGEMNAFDWRTGQPLLPERVIFGLDSIDIDPGGRFAAFGRHQSEMDVIAFDDLLQDEEFVSWPELRNIPDPHREFLERLSDDELVTWAELLSNQRLGTGGVTNNMTTAEWRNRWQAFPHRANVFLPSDSDADLNDLLVD